MSIEDYIEEHIDSEPAELSRLDRATNLRLINGRMCSGHLQGRLLKMLTRMIKPARVLELGTFSSYSSLCIAEGLDAGAMLDTVEVDDELEDFIRDALKSSPAGDKVIPHIGDALEYMRSAADASYDMLFIDADKRLYPQYYEEGMRIVRRGGYIIADNTLWYGHVIEPDAKHRDAQTEGICRFNDLVATDNRVEKVILPLRDGLTIIRIK
ncbi:MAG: O-methyltransferase [Muribaculaceae bacterium]|nr:O-methyltransferase [Muribaculaceae bacterium]